MMTELDTAQPTQPTQPSTEREHLLWLDIETTGLNKHADLVLEVAAVVTTPDDPRVDLDRFHCVIGSWAVQRPPPMENFVRQMHRGTGLLNALGDGISETVAIMQFRDFVDHWGYQSTVYLAGSGILFDRDFLTHQWGDDLFAELHYRYMDVSVLRTFTRWHAPVHTYEPHKEHRAMRDLDDSRREYRRYIDRLADTRLRLGDGE
jgi:oligoribonuclease